MIDTIRTAIVGEYEAALCMLHDCIVKCPDTHWDKPIAKFAFWHVVYHTLCCTDVYLSPTEQAFELRSDLHPKGICEIEDEYPSRRFKRDELLKYIVILRQKTHHALAAETTATLGGPSGQSHLAFSRLELHIYNIRHVEHHVGQLSAFLRTANVATRWVKTGWRD